MNYQINSKHITGLNVKHITIKSLEDNRRKVSGSRARQSLDLTTKMPVKSKEKKILIHWALSKLKTLAV